MWKKPSLILTNHLHEITSLKTNNRCYYLVLPCLRTLNFLRLACKSGSGCVISQMDNLELFKHGREGLRLFQDHPKCSREDKT